MALGNKNLIEQPFYARIKVPIVKFFYMVYFKFYYALSDLNKAGIFTCFNAKIYIEFELLKY